MTLKSEQRSGTLVLPGERLGVIEEFIPDSGTYVKDGVIYSKIIGRALMDMLNRRVSVYPLKEGAVVPKVGDYSHGSSRQCSIRQRFGSHSSKLAAKKKMSGAFGGILAH